MNDIDGILGIGPVDLTSGTVSDGKPVPTVTDNLYKEKLISAESIGISYVPTTGTSSSSGALMNGELTFGGTDSSKYTGEITYTPITSTSPASQYWGIDQSITYGSSGTKILDTTAGIVDTGTTLLYLATDAFQAYQKATGGTLDQTTGLLKVTQAQYDKMESMFFTINNTTFEWTKNAQIWPRSLNSELGGSSSDIYLVAQDNGQQSGQGLDFINGFAWRTSFIYHLCDLKLMDTLQSRGSTPSSTRPTNRSVLRTPSTPMLRRTRRAYVYADADASSRNMDWLHKRALGHFPPFLPYDHELS